MSDQGRVIFPHFSKITPESREHFQSVILQHKPYSDFNFVSIFSYDDQEEIEYSFLNDNLVLKFQDYITREPFFTFLGGNGIIETINVLLTESKKMGMRQELLMIPQSVVDFLNSEHFVVVEDLDNHDYVLSAHEISEYAGHRFSPKRNFLHRFHNNYGEFIVSKEVDLKEQEVKQQILKLFDVWEQRSKKDHIDSLRERAAIKKLLDHADLFNLFSLGVYYKDELIGFTISELLHDDFAMLHFEKADIDFVGVFPYMKSQLAKRLRDFGVKHINYEQDLGIDGLRKAKLAYHPSHYLKKYKISLKKPLSE